MSHDERDRMLNIGGVWIWLSDVQAIAPSGHALVAGLSGRFVNGSVVLLADNTPLHDKRSPEQIVKLLDIAIAGFLSGDMLLPEG